MQTAVIFIRDWVRTNGDMSKDGLSITYGCKDIESVIEQAKEMEKQQIIDAYEEQNVKWDEFIDEDGRLNLTNKYRNPIEYYNEIYGSKGSDEHIVDTNEMVDQVPDVRKMVEWIDKEILLNPYYADSPRLREGANMVKVKLQQYTPTSSQTENKGLDWLVSHWKKLESEGEKMNWQQIIQITELAKEVPEISDEEIEKEAELSYGGNERNKSVWINACKWYREQLKSKGNGETKIR